MAARPLALLLVALLFAGCISPASPLAVPPNGVVPISALKAPDASKVIDLADGARTFVFEGRSPQRVANTLPAGGVVLNGARLLDRTFDVSAAVESVDVNITFDRAVDDLQVSLFDSFDRLQCRVQFPAKEACAVPTEGTVLGLQHWRIAVDMADVGPTPGTAFLANATVHPAGLVRHADPLAGIDQAITFRNVKTGARFAGEVNLGLLANGAIFVQNGIQTMRSKDDGATWTDVSPPTTITGSCDPMLRTDPWSGRVYTAQLQCPPRGAFESMLAWSSDEGATWLANPMTGPIPGQDHEKLAVGPSPIPSSPFPVVYYGHSNPFLIVTPDGANPTFVARSLDGGSVFVPSPVTGLGDGRNAWTIGAIEADRAGNVYAPVEVCGQDFYAGPSAIGIGVSNDYGATFAFHDIATSDFSCSAGIDPGVGVDTDGVAYMAYIASGHAWYVASKDHGATWGTPVLVSLPTHTSVSHVDAVAGDAGKLAIAYRATGDSAREPSFTEGWSAWHMYVAFVDDAAGAAPRTRVALVNPPDDPVQRGCVWEYGGGQPCRNLYDFIDIAVGPDGRVYVAYPDGCPAPCPTPADSRKSAGLVGILDVGPRLFEKAPWAARADTPLVPLGV